MATLEKATIYPNAISDKHQSILCIVFLGIKANIMTIIIVKTVTECPEGRLLFFPGWTLPIMAKEVLSKTAAGLGTQNSGFNITQIRADTIDAESKVSHNLGAYRKKMESNDKPINASPNWVRFN